MVPYIDLHLHLDGSMPLGLIRELAGQEGILKEEDRVEDLVLAGDRCEDLEQFLSCFRLMETLLTKRENVERTAYEIVKTLHAQGLCYAEIRFGPFIHTAEGFDEQMVTEAVISGMRRGCEETGFHAGAILCAVVHHMDLQNRSVLELAKEYLGRGVCGFDLAGPEGAVPMEHFRPLFAEAARAGVPFTIHAGECGSYENVMTAVSYGARRIGHGTAAVRSDECMKLLARENIPLEVCVTSNYQTQAVKSGETHPIRAFLEAGIPVTFNTDDMTVSGITLQSEAELLKTRFGFSDRELEDMQKTAVRASFAPEELKECILSTQRGY